MLSYRSELLAKIHDRSNRWSLGMVHHDWCAEPTAPEVLDGQPIKLAVPPVDRLGKDLWNHKGMFGERPLESRGHVWSCLFHPHGRLPCKTDAL